MKRKQLVLIKATFRDAGGNTRYKIGTGYFITPALVLTSNHVLPAADCDRLQVRVEESGKWLEAETIPRWKSLQLDAALIKTKTPIDIEQPIQWEENPLEDSAPIDWYSDGYPEAGKELNENNEEYYKTKGLKGSWHPFGGMGAGKNPRLDLEVSAKPANPEQWAGISGAPVFIKNNSDEERLIGIIRNVPTNFPDRLEGIPAFELLKDPGFTAALEEDKFTLPGDDNWALIIVSDNPDKERFTRPVKSAIEATLGEDYPQLIENINDVLEKPGVLLNFIQMICRAPIMIIDATGFQPGIMMLMGIRSVVRRGVTIVATTNPIDPSLINDPMLFDPLPFNIQEIKLITLDFESYPLGRVLSAIDRLKIAINEGKSQLQVNPGYLDLPPFDAIRKPVVVDIPTIREKILLLCPFSKDHKTRFNFIRSEVTDGKKTEDILRMLDITSPQLVGQSLYEHIRWCDVCIIDWSNWRANVFTNWVCAWRLPI